MSNNLSEKVTAYTRKLDEKVRQGALTSDLNINGDLLGELTGAGQIKIAKLSMAGLADHTRGGGFTKGDVTLTWETMSLAYDRDREFDIDAMDDEEHLGIVTAHAMGTFAREKVIPEVDAIRFAKLAANATTEGTATPATYSTASDAFDAVLAAEEFMQDNGSALPDCVFYCSPRMKTLLRKASADSFFLRPGEAPNTNFQAFDEMKLVIVPAVRFYTGIELYDGKSSGETDGGYAKATDKYVETEDTAYDSSKTYYTRSGNTYSAASISAFANGTTYYEKVQDAGCDINFMIVNPNVGEAVVKHNPLRYFDPETNQTDDAHKWQYRLYHDLLLYENKLTGIYLSAKSS
jgi:hypothetical protein